ncbi:MAG: hypothetical protein OEQ13_04015, partial [Acidobacteriota bacterium]|nr:hypothetical protein [Acidobacteriota bacterium]
MALVTETLGVYLAGGLVTLLTYWLLVPRRWRSLVLLVASSLFIASYEIGYALFFLFNTAVVYYLAGLIRRAEGGKVRILQASLVWLIGGLCLFKYVRPLSSFLPEDAVPSIVASLVLPLGMSYITFRMIHYVVEVYRGKAHASSFADFASYVLFFPTYISGPVERFPA